MNIGIMSGKGGTGKTTVSTNLAALLKANYIDCDVEEPNGFIFLKPEVISTYSVDIGFPYIDEKKCTYCGKCVEVCQFNALSKVKKDIILFEKLCHDCGACKIACKYGALDYKKRSIGKVEVAKYKDSICKRGLLNISEPFAVPIINELLKDLPKAINILDCSPGTSCNVVNTLEHVDYGILVAEPTEFGLHDLKMAVELLKMFNLPFGIIINKEMNKDNIIRKYCLDNDINIIGNIPYDKKIAEMYSRGQMLIENEKFESLFEDIWNNAKGELMWKL